MSSLPRIASIAFLFLFFAGLAVSQGSAVTCSAISSPAPVIRTDGEAEVNGDLVVKCTGGVPTLVDRPLPPVNIAIFLNEAVTSRLLAPGFSEALLLIDEPPAASQLACANTNNVCTIIANGTGVGEYDGTQGRPNVFQGIPGSGNNSIQWNNIPFDPPGQNIRTLRFVNIRGNALGGPASVIMSFSISGQVPVFVNVSQQPVASAQSGLGFSAKNVLGGAAVLLSSRCRMQKDSVPRSKPGPPPRSSMPTRRPHRRTRIRWAHLTRAVKPGFLILDFPAFPDAATWARLDWRTAERA